MKPNWPGGYAGEQFWDEQGVWTWTAQPDAPLRLRVQALQDVYATSIELAADLLAKDAAKLACLLLLDPRYQAVMLVKQPALGEWRFTPTVQAIAELARPKDENAVFKGEPS